MLIESGYQTEITNGVLMPPPSFLKEVGQQKETHPYNFHNPKAPTHTASTSTSEM